MIKQITIGLSLAIVVSLGVMLPGGATAAPKADLVLKNGTVLTMNSKNPVKRAVAVRNGRILFAGSTAGAKKYIRGGTKVINLKGKTVMPGLVDGHSHPLAGGDILDDCDLGNIEATISEQLAIVAECDAADPASNDSDWLEVSNWSPVGVIPTGTIVTRQDLDAAFPDRPVYIQGSDFHNSWVNTRALELAGITKDTPDPADGSFEREQDGTPTGLIKDEAQWMVKSAIPEKKFSAVVADAARAVKAMNAQGITTTADSAADPGTLAAWQALAGKNKMSIRMVSMLITDSEQPVNEIVSYYKKMKKKFGTGNERVAGIKLMLDGVIEYPAQTAALLAPYLVEKDGQMVPGTSKGELYQTQKHANAVTTRFDRMKKLVHMHSIGDGAARLGLNAAAAARKANDSYGRRNISIGHLQLVHPSDYGRFRKLGVFADMQLHWAIRDFWTEDSLHPYIGDKRFNRMYPAGSLIKAGAPFSMGSDWPVDPLNPWAEIVTAFARSSGIGDFLVPSESIPVARALRAHTAGSAAQLGLSKKVGTITRGKDADIIVVNRNPLKASPPQLYATKVLRTIVRGKTVYRPNKASAKLAEAAAVRSTGEAGHTHAN